jgi:sRNA-binding protein
MSSRLHHWLNKLLFGFGLTLFFTSCGADRDVELEEIKLNLKQLESEVRELKSSHRAELDLIKQKLLAERKRAHQLLKHEGESKGLSHNSIGHMRSEAQRRVSLTRAKRDEHKAVQIVRQLFNRRSVDEITRVLNEQQLKTSLGRSYTKDIVLKIIKDHALAMPK